MDAFSLGSFPSRPTFSWKFQPNRFFQIFQTEQSLIQCTNHCGARCDSGCSVCPANVPANILSRQRPKFPDEMPTKCGARYHSNSWISAYIAGACAISLVCLSLLKETRETDLRTGMAVNVGSVP
jgi:hypothetical protein